MINKPKRSRKRVKDVVLIKFRDVELNSIRTP